MANHGLATLEAALRSRKLDRTLVISPHLPQGVPDHAALAPTAIEALDERLGGGLPRGQLSEITGAASTGRTTLLMQMLAAATQRGEIAALVDTCDRGDVASAAAAGVDLDRLLWIRGDAISSGSLSLCDPAHSDRLVDRALKALNLVLQAGGFGVVALDLADVPVASLHRIPFTTWPRIQRTIEGSDTVCVLVGSHPMARSAGGLTLMLSATPRYLPERLHDVPSHLPERLHDGPSHLRARRFEGMDVNVRVGSPRRQVQGDIRVCCDSRD